MPVKIIILLVKTVCSHQIKMATAHFAPSEHQLCDVQHCVLASKAFYYYHYFDLLVAKEFS